MAKQLHIHLDDREHEHFKTSAKQLDLSISQLARRVIREWLKKNKSIGRVAELHNDDTNA